MNPEIKQKWLDELPKHTQATGHLKTSTGMCCLGVLCEVAKKEDQYIGDWERGPLKDDFYFLSEEGYESLILPGPVKDWADFSDSIGSLPYLDRQGKYITLAEANDQGCTFDQIADLIKQFF